MTFFPPEPDLETRLTSAPTQASPTSRTTAVEARATNLFEERREEIYRETDHLFAGLLVFEWMAGLVTAIVISPRSWAGSESWIHPHVWMAAVLGGVIVLPPFALCVFRAGRTSTRHVIAIAQMLFGSLLIHLTGGRIETHFHIFGSLALLAFYRDWRVLVSASIVVVIDHGWRGLYWPRSIYGAEAIEPWRWIEHGGWVLFEVLFLIRSCLRSVREMRSLAERQAQLEDIRMRIEQEVETRTAQLRESEAYKTTIFESALDAIVTMDGDGRILEWNLAAKTMFGLLPAHAIGLSLSDLLSLVAFDDKPLKMDGRFLRTRCGNGQPGRIEAIATRWDGARFPCEVSISPIVHANSTLFTAFVRDVTEQKWIEERLTYQATHDALTALPNRVFFQAELGKSLVIDAGGEPRPAALLLIDLDRFKEINDTFGHHYGDVVLRRLSPRLRDAVAASGVVARLGGDEFGVLIPGGDGPAANALAEAILKSLEQPFLIDGHMLDIGASVGIALCPAHGREPVSLLQHADVAMYAAKRAHAGYLTYSAGQSDYTPRRLGLINDLRPGIEKDQLELYYQPKIELRSKRVLGVEALVRWQHPREGLLLPGEFIPLAEHAGLMRPLGAWALGKAMDQCGSWRGLGLEIGVAVNLSADNLTDPGLFGVVSNLLEASGTRPEWLTIEITESAMMADPTLARKTLGRLHDLGVRASVDDFGTGYSSLAYLKDLPLDEVKIDRSFVKNLSSGGPGLSIVRAIIDLGHTLSFRIVAEGVEDEETLDVLGMLDCDTVQGYYYSRPLPATDFLTWFHRHASLASKPRALSLAGASGNGRS